MATEVIMPKAGMDMQEGEIIKWNFSVGDYVERGQILLEIMTDKVSMEVEAEESGYLLKTLYSSGDIVPVITTIGYIGEKDEVIEDSSEAKKSNNKDVKYNSKVVDEPEFVGESNSSNDGGYEFDFIVIGGGPAGYVSAIKAAQLGSKVAIIEKDNFGGTCLNRGCIPTKTYLKNAEIIESINHAKNRGIYIKDSSFEIDMTKTVKHKNDVVKKLTSGVKYLLKSRDVEIINGLGKVVGSNTVEVGGRQLTGKYILLAGGSEVSKLNIRGIDSNLVLTSDEILDMEYIPKHLVIVGAGVIGLEMAMLFKAYGSDVSVVEMLPRPLANMDEEISNFIRKDMEKNGIKFYFDTKLEEFEEIGESIVVKTDKDVLTADRVLISIGRKPDLSCVKDIDIELEGNRVKVDEFMQTSVPSIFAIGDINGKRMLAHAAFKMGELVVENLVTGENNKLDLNKVPSAIYTNPEVSAIGLTEAEAREKYSNVKIGKFDFSANGRALSVDEGRGFVKVVVDGKYGEILGTHIVGPSASELINQISYLMDNEITVYEAIRAVNTHPSYSEALLEALMDSIDMSIHLPKK